MIIAPDMNRRSRVRVPLSSILFIVLNTNYLLGQFQVDYNRNGVIEFDEFVDLMMRDYAHIDHETDICNAFR